jgi:spore photoproduct lyase
VVDTLYIEEEVRDHPRTRMICDRFSRARRIYCDRYGEIFNRQAQNFRLQKKNPALILAVKKGQKVHATPEGYGIGHVHNYYFSHMLNCMYDCRYCFLQGMFQSAHHVLFVNYEDFQDSISRQEESRGETCCFFSGYDCDSLALDSVTRFSESFLPFFRDRLERSWIELRTKSVHVQPFMEQEPFERCIIAFSMTPEEFSRKLEHGVPSLESRLDAMRRLQDRGWNVGIRFDPLLYHSAYKSIYDSFFRDVFSRLSPRRLHSVSLGSFRVPGGMFKRMEKFYPDAPLFGGPLNERDSLVRYEDNIEQDLIDYCERNILEHIEPQQFFPCRRTVAGQESR